MDLPRGFTVAPIQTGLLVQSVPDCLSREEVGISVLSSFSVSNHEAVGLHCQMPPHQTGVGLFHVVEPLQCGVVGNHCELVPPPVILEFLHCPSDLHGLLLLNDRIVPFGLVELTAQEENGLLSLAGRLR